MRPGTYFWDKEGLVFLARNKFLRLSEGTQYPASIDDIFVSIEYVQQKYIFANNTTVCVPYVKPLPQNSENKPRGSYFSRALFEGLIFGQRGKYLRREICVSKSIGLALKLEVNLPFLLCFTLYLRAISKYKPSGGLHLDGRFYGVFFSSPV